MAGLFVKIFKQWAETAIVNKLADNRSMQKAAVGAVEAAQMAQRLAESAAKDPSQLTAGLSSLWTALQKEASKDLGTSVNGGGGETVIDVSSSSRPPVPITDSFSKMSSKELKENLIKRGISVSGLFEKSELLAAAREGGGGGRSEEGGSNASEKMR